MVCLNRPHHFKFFHRLSSTRFIWSILEFFRSFFLILFPFLKAIWEDDEIKLHPASLNSSVEYWIAVLHIKLNRVISNFNPWGYHRFSTSNFTLRKLERACSKCLEMWHVGSCYKLWGCIVEEGNCYASLMHSTKITFKNSFSC